MKTIFIGFDFSMNKPAMTILYNKVFDFVIWPAKISDKRRALYLNNGVKCYSRGLSEISAKHEDSSKVVIMHTIRSVELANMIVNDIKMFMNEHDAEDAQLFIASEGLSFGSTGNATLNLATYKGVLLAKLYEAFGEQIVRLCTYPPISIKSTAKCATKDKIKDKKAMISAFLQEKIELPFKTALKYGIFSTKQKGFIACVDDIVDSYFALKTMLKKEGLI